MYPAVDDIKPRQDVAKAKPEEVVDIQEHNAVVPEKFIVGGTEFDITGQPIMVELFCGTAGCREILRKHRLESNRDRQGKLHHLPRTQILSGDLTNSDLQRELLRLAEHPDLKYIHAAPPCGTSSRARDRPMPKHYRDAGLPDEKPACSELHPRGLPELEGSDPRLHLRVSVANILYDFAAKLMGKMSRLKKVMSVENPSRSYFWHIDEYKALLSPETLFGICVLMVERGRWQGDCGAARSLPS